MTDTKKKKIASKIPPRVAKKISKPKKVEKGKDPVILETKKTKNYDIDYHLSEFDHPAFVANFYGFVPINTPEITKDDHIKAKKISAQLPKDAKQSKHISRMEERVCIFRTYMEKNMASLPHPIMIHYLRPFPGQDSRRSSTDHHFVLEIIGLHKAIAEAILIQTASAILSDEGYPDINIEINTMGDKQSTTDLERGISAFIKRNSQHIPPESQKSIRLNLLNIYSELSPDNFNESIPTSIDHLTEPSRQHFKELLEFMESLGIPYKVNSSLIQNKDNHCQTIFEIRETTKDGQQGQLLANGTRQNQIGKKSGLKKDIPSVITTFYFKKKKEQKKYSPSKFSKPRFSFVQIGPEAKFKSLGVIEELRRLSIPVYHSLTKDKLLSQLQTAENQRIPYLIIMGQKEAMENSVVIRDMSTRHQEIISIDNLGKSIKKRYS